MNFIRTSDIEVANYLRNCGYTEIKELSSSTFCFINDGKMIFDADMDKNIHYTNMLYV